MHISDQVKYILQKLADNGFEGYLVGGCVRDYLLSKEPSDFDITTSALPEETEKVFECEKVIPTGVKHGTVTVLHDGYAFEITTYRTETTYTDGRHPDKVEFSRNLADDLCRRDFTVNAMALGLDGNIVDLYGGREDLEKHIIRAVGDPHERFTEDALRILRAFRFAAKLGFDIDGETLAAAIKLSPRLSLVSRERIFAELEKLLCGVKASKVIRIMADASVFESIFENPDISNCAAELIDSLPFRADIRLAALFLGDKNAENHIASLKTSAEFADRVKKTIRASLPKDYSLPTVRRAMHACGADILKDRALIERNTTLFDTVNSLAMSENCFGVSDLKISGADIMANTSLRGREIGEKLTEVLYAVFDGKIPNTYDAEIALIKS